MRAHQFGEIHGSCEEARGLANVTGGASNGGVAFGAGRGGAGRQEQELGMGKWNPGPRPTRGDDVFGGDAMKTLML